MVDFNDTPHLVSLANQNIVLADRYHKARKRYAEAKLFLDLRLSLELPILRKKRSNIGYDMAMLMLIENNHNSDEIQAFYKQYVIQESEYKGLEKLMIATSGRISLGQSLIKMEIQNT